MKNIIFELKDVYFSYLGKFPALCGISLEICKGEKVAIVGANGSGKSSFLHLLDGLIFADKGTVNFYGKSLNENAFNEIEFSRQFRLSVGFVFQNPDVQLFCPTVKDDLVFGPLHLGIPKPEIEFRFNKLVDMLGIEDLLERSPYQLSIGEKRKVAIASVLISKPEVLILDEPTAGLDPKTTRQIIDLLLDASSEGNTLITSTHDLHIVEEISDTVHVFGKEKKIVKSGFAHDLLDDEELLKENNLLHIHAHKHDGKAHIHPHIHWGHHQEE